MARLINEIGNKYGFLTPIERIKNYKTNDTHAYYKCKCDCGNETIVNSYQLRSGRIKSCGCKKTLEHHAHNLSLIGNRFGNLVIERPGKYINNKYYWFCKCDCGNEIETSESNLKYGKSTQCVECSKKNRAITKALKYIQPENKFGRLTVIEKVKSPSANNTKAYYRCRCDCGNETIVCGALLRNGITKSCGCLRKELNTDTTIIGKKYGMLTILNIDKIENGKKYVKCKCDCGNICVKKFTEIQRGNTKSCGCLNESFGEKKISEILKKLSITNHPQQIFPDLLNEQQTSYLKFDFAVKARNGRKIYFLIEYDGIQHYKEVPFFQTPLSEVQKRDKIKNDYCRNKNIPLLRIPYWEFNNIESILINYINTNFSFLIKKPI